MTSFYSIPFEQLKFDHKRHKYFNKQGKEYISVTTLIKGDEEEFDAEKIAEKVIKDPRSKYFGMDKEVVKSKWKKSAPAGTSVHKAVEDYINNRLLPKDENTRPLVEQFSKLKFRGQLISEVIVHDDEYLIAGTADILELCNNEIWLWDLKTAVPGTNGKEISKDKLYKFSLQLELYKRLIEKCFNTSCKIGGIIWFKDYINQKGNTKLSIFRVDKVEQQVDAMLIKRRMQVLGERV